MKERFDFVDAYRGPMVRLRWEHYDVMLADWPESLLAMHKAGVLAGPALEEAKLLETQLREEAAT